ncbi:hypothetical protein D3C76_1088920 [compost metagenome]
MGDHLDIRADAFSNDPLCLLGQVQQGKAFGYPAPALADRSAQSVRVAAVVVLQLLLQHAGFIELRKVEAVDVLGQLDLLDLLFRQLAITHRRHIIEVSKARRAIAALPGHHPPRLGAIVVGAENDWLQYADFADISGQVGQLLLVALQFVLVALLLVELDFAALHHREGRATRVGADGRQHVVETIQVHHVAQVAERAALGLGLGCCFCGTHFEASRPRPFRMIFIAATHSAAALLWPLPRTPRHTGLPRAIDCLTAARSPSTIGRIFGPTWG